MLRYTEYVSGILKEYNLLNGETMGMQIIWFYAKQNKTQTKQNEIIVALCQQHMQSKKEKMHNIDMAEKNFGINSMSTYKQNHNPESVNCDWTIFN